MSTNYTILDGNGASQTFTAYGADLLAELQSILAKLSADPATQTTLAAVLSALEGTLTVDGSGATQPVSAAALPLPSGAATAANQASILAKLSADPATQTTLAAVLSALQGTLTVDGSSATQPVSASALPLPSGAATAANQASILAKLSADPATQTTLAAVLSALHGTLTADPAAVTLTWATGTAASSGDNTLVAAPGAGNRLVIYSLIVQNESATATTAIVKSGSTARARVLGQNQGDGIAFNFPAGRELRCGTNEALVVNLSGANSHGYSVAYTVEAV